MQWRQRQIAFCQGGADGDARVQIAVEAEVAHASGIRAARRAFSPRGMKALKALVKPDDKLTHRAGSEMICMARIFDAPLTVPAGNAACIHHC